MELNNISYLIMVPYDADKLYIYNIVNATILHISKILYL